MYPPASIAKVRMLIILSKLEATNVTPSTMASTRTNVSLCTLSFSKSHLSFIVCYLNHRSALKKNQRKTLKCQRTFLLQTFPPILSHHYARMVLSFFLRCFSFSITFRSNFSIFSFLNGSPTSTTLSCSFSTKV